MKIAGGIIAALLAFVVALLIQIHGLPIIGGGLLADLDRMTELRTAERNSHRTTKANVRTAQASARAAQAAANRQPAQTSAIIARISDATAPAYYDAVRRAGADRVRPGGKAAECAGGAADLPRTDHPARSDVERPETTAMVSVATGDWTDILAAAGQGAMCARAGQELIARGVAVPSSGVDQADNH
ncbi:MAG: hypothetical protein B7Y36_18945 [Novosphingobium sp. 28-62-57]|nr:MAG: hypothetical protein B7Z34_02480 [Novosphingobium sp. 12-62-10]OYZ07725.1 MAG: hypothetical protein B7Y36_18945 [Novosphingobium sp. 28-62-57]